MNGDTVRSALVTGATGFVGSHLVRRLVLLGWRVTTIMRETSKVDALQSVAERVQVLRTDGSSQDLTSAIARSEAQVVFHLASTFIAEHQERDVPSLIRSNLEFATMLVESMDRHGMKNLVNTGTAWQHFHGDGNCPVNLYAATKQAFEAILDYYVAARNLKVITLKLFDTYGPDDRRRKLIEILRESAQTGRALSMSPGAQLVSLVYIDDVIDAFVQAGERLLTGGTAGHEAYAVNAEQAISLRDLADLSGEVFGNKPVISWGGRPYREREVMQPWAGRRLPGWMPRVTLREGLSRLIN